MRAIFISFLTSTLFFASAYIYAGDFPQAPQQNDRKTINRETIKEHAITTKGTISEAEKNIIIKQCTQAWQRYRTALSKRDIEEALKNVSNNSKREFRSALQYQRTPIELGDIKAEDIKDTIARFNMSVKMKLQPGDSIAPGYSIGDSIVVDAYVVFIRESDGSWKIDFY